MYIHNIVRRTIDESKCKAAVMWLTCSSHSLTSDSHLKDTSAFPWFLNRVAGYCCQSETTFHLTANRRKTRLERNKCEEGSACNSWLSKLNVVYRDHGLSGADVPALPYALAALHLQEQECFLRCARAKLVRCAGFPYVGLS